MLKRRRQFKKDEKEKDFDKLLTKYSKILSQTIEIALTCEIKIIS
jgi:hypothetical protein